MTNNNTALRTGYTTGTCAAAAAYAAACCMVNITVLSTVIVDLPNNETIEIPVKYVHGSRSSAEAAVCKFSGDDPDITNGTTVIVKVNRCTSGDVNFFAGEGIGTVTKKGLSIPPGEPAINPVPRKMIRDSIRKVCNMPVDVTISIPGGKLLAERTFNPRLGIIGGLSILGTTGIVRPFSRKAIQDTIKYKFSIAKENNIRQLYLVPGNIGKKAVVSIFSPVSDSIIEVSNEWGFSIDAVTAFNFNQITVAGHPGKMAKIAEDKWDTHSSNSRSAFDYVKQTCLSFVKDFNILETSTIEGLFQSLKPEAQSGVSRLIANAVHSKIKDRMKTDVILLVVLTDMQGNEYGRSDL